MSTTPEPEQPSFRCESPSPSSSPTPAINNCPELSRSVSDSTAPVQRSLSMNTGGRDSMASSVGSSVSRSSSAGYSCSNRQSTGTFGKQTNRRGYVRPQGTNFAKSAQSRESVLSLGSIMHLQYYFARTGLLDGKGGRLAKDRGGNRRTLDLSPLETGFLSPSLMGTDADSSYASMGSSPELLAQGHGGMMVESPTQEGDEYYISGEEDEEHPHMLPPTVSTYNQREKYIPKPPTLEELKEELQKALGDAAKVLASATVSASATEYHTPTPPASPSNKSSRPKSENEIHGWFGIEGMHILDIMTLAIRAAKMYYTAHNLPARLSAIKSERHIRAELLSVMDVLRRMATRNFANGMRTEERDIMEGWVSGVYDMLDREAAMEAAERKKRASWTWLADTWEGTASSWDGREIEREYSFMQCMDPSSDTLPNFRPVESVLYDDELPTEWLKEMRTGLRLIRLHNALVRKSKRNFGAVEKWHTEFGKPYRSAENLRFWIKAAELRWEVQLHVDVLAVVQGTDRTALKAFEDAIWKWCRKVREEISAEWRV